MTSLMDFERKHKKEIEEKYFNLEVVEKIFELMDRKKINQTQLAEKMGLSKSQVSRLLSDERNLTLASIKKIFTALGEEPAIMTKREIKNLKSPAIQKTVTLSYPRKVTVSYEHLNINNFSKNKYKVITSRIKA